MPKPKRSKSGRSSGRKRSGASSKSGKKKKASVKQEIDILTPAANENLYYIAHNAVMALEMRGFGWKGGKGKKKKGGKGKKKKKK